MPFAILNAQPSLESNIWYFGINAGLDFNSGSPVALTNGVLNTLEGTASIADKNTGKLLFYTDGSTVYDTTHSIMSNGTGLWGHPSSTQSGVVVPDPGNANLFYIFTAAAQAGCCFMPLQPYDGIAYSIVDMTLNGGLGAVTTKNVQLVHPATEKITAVRHCNGRDVWIITHEWNTNAFYSYLLTPTGVQPPVISNVGVVHQSPSGNNSESIGYMKAAPDQQHIGLCIFYPECIVELFDFDNVLGTLSNPMTDYMPCPPPYGGPYGCSFSPDGSKFYAAYHDSPPSFTNPNYVFQYDMNAGTPAAVLASRTFVASSTSVSYGALQLASDGKLYMGTFSQNIGVPVGSPTIDRFTNPNGLGIGAVGYVANAVFLNGGKSVWGLPDYMESFFSPPVATNFNDTTICVGATVNFNPVYGIAMDSVSWDFDDLPSGALNYSVLNAPSHTFNTAGVYDVKLVVHYNCHHDTLARTVTVTLLPISLGNDTTLCIGSALTLDPNYPGAVYSWSTGVTTQTISVSNPGGSFWVEVTDGLCQNRDTINVAFNPPPQVNLGNDTTICNGQNLVLNAGNPGAGYLWSTGATTQSIVPLLTGNYTVTVDLTGCIDKDTIGVTVNQPPVVFLGNDTVLCNGQALQLNAAVAGYTNLWSNGTTNNSISVSSAGVYFVQMTNGVCLVTDTINVQFNPPPVVNLGNDTTICNGQSLVLNAGNPGSAYLWSTGVTTQTISPLVTGSYSVTANLSGCIDKDTIVITVNQPPVIFLGNDTVLCNGQVLQLNASAAGYTNLWSNGTTNNSINVNASGTFSVQLTNGVCTVTDTINVIFNPPPVANIGNDTTICSNGSVTLDAGNTGSVYLWSNGATTQVITTSAAGTYSVMVNLSGCTDKDTMQLTVISPPVISLGNDTVLCDGEILTLNSSSAGYTNLWSTGSTANSIQVAVTGIYSIQLDNGICTVTDSINVNFDLPPVVNLGNDSTLCQGQILQLDAGVPVALYLWNTGATTQQISVSSNGIFSVAVTAGACTRGDSIQVNFRPLLPVNLGSDTTLCQGQAVTLQTALNGYIYLWNTGATTQSIVVNSIGTYNLEVFDGLCKSYDSINVNIIAYPVVNLGNDTAWCSNIPVLLDGGNPGASYLWSTGATTKSIEPGTPGNYWVIAAFGNCSASDSVNIDLLPSPIVNLGNDSSLCSGDVVTIDAGNPGAIFLWNDGYTLQTKTIVERGLYSVSVTNADGCVETDSIEFGSLGCIFYLFLPNTFTPNSDGKNDFFHAYPYNVLSIDMAIYNRYGEKIFFTDNLEPGWDGKFNNVPCQEDVYAVLINYSGEDENGKIIKRNKKTTVRLIR